MSNVITIPKKLASKDDLVVIPKREYREFALWKTSVRVNLNEQWFWTPEWQKREAEADEAIRKGKITGPFSNNRKLLLFLKSKKKS